MTSRLERLHAWAAVGWLALIGGGGLGFVARDVLHAGRTLVALAWVAGAALGAAPTAIPGVVFQGAGDGRLFAVSATDGKQLWEFNTAQDFDTANKVPARGGAIATAGAVVVDGMVYIASGYAINSGAQAGRSGAPTRCSPRRAS